MRSAIVRRSARKGKKWTAKLIDKKGYVVGTVNFGDSSRADFTKHHDKKRRWRYLKRMGGVYPENKKNDIDYQPTRSNKQNWTYSGWNTPGFWSRWLLWSAPTLSEAARGIQIRFDIEVNIIYN